MSRFIRKHESDWQLLIGAYDLMGKTYDLMGKKKTESNDVLVAQHLVDNGGVETLEEAEELIWFANCCGGSTCTQSQSESETFDFRRLRALFFNTENNTFRLPPEPK